MFLDSSARIRQLEAMEHIALIGAGLAGCECALFLASHGFCVTLFEQKPHTFSPAHSSEYLAELVCSNSFRSDELSSGVGLLKAELRELGSFSMQAADATRVPAGKALAVDREAYSRLLTQQIHDHPHITLVHCEIQSLEAPELAPFSQIIVAAGPVASESLSASLAKSLGTEHLYFYDAIAPIVWGDDIDMTVAFWGSRYEEGEEGGDYLNCPMSQEEYRTFYNALCEAEKVGAKNFEKEQHFEGCMPIEALAERGDRTLTFGPLKPVGFIDPRTGRRPYALLQLRPENANRSLFNLVGCQTKLSYAAQDIVFRLVPGLEKVSFARHGSMHRNTYVNAPQVLQDDLSLKVMPHVHLAGQITGVEGYVESIACGLWLGMMLTAKAKGLTLPKPPQESALGALLGHLERPVKNFQPSNVNFGLMPEIEGRIKKKERKAMYSTRAREHFAQWLQNVSQSGLFESKVQGSQAERFNLE